MGALRHGVGREGNFEFENFKFQMKKEKRKKKARGPRRELRRRGYRSDEPKLSGVTRDWLAEVFVAEVGDGLLVQVGVVGVEGGAEGGVHGGGCGDAIEEAADVADAA